METSDIHIGPESAFHMLRHFVDIQDSLREQLIQSGRTLEAIEKELKEPGSRFHTVFAQDINMILGHISNDGYKKDRGVNGNLIWVGKANELDFPNGAGTLSVVHIDSIPEKDRNKLFIMQNRGLQMLHYPVAQLPNTAEYTVILKPTNPQPVFITAFPGPPAMPLPVRKMEQSLYDLCKIYWKTHAFLVMSS